MSAESGNHAAGRGSNQFHKKVLALIPARAGSQRVKSKNIKPLAGKPLIAYTIEAAKKSRYVTRVIVSTDSSEIAAIAKNFGAEVPFMRPEELAASHSTELEFHEHALQWLKDNEGYEPDLVVNLYPTTPFRDEILIDQAIEKILSHPEVDSLRSTRKCSEHPYKMWVKEGDLLRPFVEATSGENHTAAYHLLPPVQIQNASIYITRPKTLSQYRNTVGEKVLSFEMSEEASVDINTPLDFLVAEAVIQESSRKGVEI